MVNQRYCPFCKAPAAQHCGHLALAAEGRNFVRQCVESCHGQKQWEALCERRRRSQRLSGNWSPDKEDFVWLETAFCNEFLKHLAWFGGLDYEWRTNRGLDKGGFWVLLWSRNPQRLWWELRDEFERQSLGLPFLLRPEPPGQSSFNYNYRI